MIVGFRKDIIILLQLLVLDDYIYGLQLELSIRLVENWKICEFTIAIPACFQVPSSHVLSCL
jgi:hypothetical protein